MKELVAKRVGIQCFCSTQFTVLPLDMESWQRICSIIYNAYNLDRRREVPTQVRLKIWP